MGVFVTVNDFKEGYNKIPFNSHSLNKLDTFITDYEKKYLYMIFGIELGDLIINDGNPPATPKYLVLYNPLQVQAGRKIYISNGLKEVLKGFIRSEYMKELQKVDTTSGQGSSSNENTNISTSANYYGYNENVIQAKAIQYYIRNNSSDYPEFNAMWLETISPLW
jgi:hypothetical protein